ncbi:hypothetical protein CAPTEDRAFT_192228, partial [Capitella teleta]
MSESSSQDSRHSDSSSRVSYSSQDTFCSASSPSNGRKSEASEKQPIRPDGKLLNHRPSYRDVQSTKIPTKYKNPYEKETKEEKDEEGKRRKGGRKRKKKIDEAARVSKIVQDKLELFLNQEQREIRFHPLGPFPTTPRMHKYEVAYKLADSKPPPGAKSAGAKRGEAFISPRLVMNSRRVASEQQAERLSGYAKSVIDTIPVNRLSVIHRYRPRSGAVTTSTENGHVQNYTSHVGAALHSETYVQYYRREGLDSGRNVKFPYAAKLPKIETKNIAFEPTKSVKKSAMNKKPKKPTKDSQATEEAVEEEKGESLNESIEDEEKPVIDDEYNGNDVTVVDESKSAGDVVDISNGNIEDLDACNGNQEEQKEEQIHTETNNDDLRANQENPPNVPNGNNLTASPSENTSYTKQASSEGNVGEKESKGTDNGHTLHVDIDDTKQSDRAMGDEDDCDVDDDFIATPRSRHDEEPKDIHKMIALQPIKPTNTDDLAKEKKGVRSASTSGNFGATQSSTQKTLNDEPIVADEKSECKENKSQIEKQPSLNNTSECAADESQEQNQGQQSPKEESQ